MHALAKLPDAMSCTPDNVSTPPGPSCVLNSTSATPTKSTQPYEHVCALQERQLLGEDGVELQRRCLEAAEWTAHETNRLKLPTLELESPQVCSQ